MLVEGTMRAQEAAKGLRLPTLDQFAVRCCLFPDPAHWKRWPVGGACLQISDGALRTVPGTSSGSGSWNVQAPLNIQACLRPITFET